MDKRCLCLDTNVIIELFRGNLEVKRVIEEFPGSIATTTITVMELLTNMSERKRDLYLQFLSGLIILDFDFRSTIIAADIIRDLKKKGLVLDLRDIMIASICIANSVPLYTLNRKHFERLKEYGLILI